jgi:hypothetical protein
MSAFKRKTCSGLPVSPSRVILQVLRFQEARRSVRDSSIPLIDEEDEETSFENKDDFANTDVAAVEARRQCVPSIDDTVRSDYSVDDKEIDDKEVRFQNIETEKYFVQIFVLSVEGGLKDR